MTDPAARDAVGEPGPETPPPLGSWARLYALVLAALLVDLVLLGWLTERYR